MGKIFNRVALGDPCETVHLAGFNNLNDALNFVEANFFGGGPVFQTILERGHSYEFSGSPWIVFYVTQTDRVLRAVAQYIDGAGDLKIGSYGNQFQLTPE